MFFGDHDKTGSEDCGACLGCLSKVDNYWGVPITMGRMVVCLKCGNKRCPKAGWHGYKCTGSNDIGQTPEPESK